MSSIVFWVAFLPLLIVIPLGIVVWTYYQVRRHDLLPKAGRRRALALFFTRLILIFIVMWLPGLSLVFFGGIVSSPWFTWIGVTWAHLQSAAAGIAALLKPDINKAVVDLLLCRSREEPREAYRVAIQSVSAVLENCSETSDVHHHHNQNKDDENKCSKPNQNHKAPQQESDPEQALSPDSVESSNGDPEAYWPSQRPVRQNPRLQRWQREHGYELKEEPSTQATQSVTTQHTSSTSSSSVLERGDCNTRSVARNLLLALEKDNEQ